MKPKNAQISTIFVIVVLIAIFLVMALFFTNIGNMLTQEGDITDIALCEASVYAQSALQTRLDLESFRVNLKCPPRDVTLPGDMSDPTDIVTAKQMMAEEMKDCWDKFGNGQVELFQGEGTFCSVCSWIEFEDTNEAFGGMGRYLATQTVDGKLSYYDYLMNFESPMFKTYFDQQQQEQTLPAVDDIDTSKLYSVVHVYARGESAMNEFKDSIGPGMSFVAGAVTFSFVGGIAVYAAGASTVGTFVLGAPVVGTLIRSLAISALQYGTLGAGISSTMATMIQDEPGWMASTFLVEHNEQAFRELACQQYTTTKD